MTLFSIPGSWAWASFGDVARIASNLVDPKDHQSKPHIAPNHIESWSGRIFNYTTIRNDGVASPKHHFHPGQILYSKIRPYLAKVALADFGGLCSADMYPIESDIDVRYLKWWMLTPMFVEESTKYQGRVVLPKINAAALRKLPVPVPSMAEQQRIVAALEGHLSRLDAAERNIDASLKRLEALRKRVIVDAVPIPGPDHWKLASVDDAGTIDLGRQRHPDWHTGPNMRPYLRVANVFEDRIDLRDVMQMDFPPAVFERFRLVEGDILLNEGQSPEYLGRPAMYRGDPKEVAFTNSILRFRAHSNVHPEWALLVFRRHMHAKRFMREVRITTNLAHLSAGRLKSVEFPIPPLGEQEEIVDEVRERLSLITRLSTALKAAKRRSGHLRQGLLREAFAGRLLPQDPTDEPASELLARIRAERAQQPKTTRARRTKPKDSPAATRTEWPDAGRTPVNYEQGELL